MKKAQLQEIKAYLDALNPTGDLADYNRAIDWFWQNYPPPTNRPAAHNHVFDRFSFQAFERLGLNKPPYPAPINVVKYG